MISWHGIGSWCDERLGVQINTILRLFQVEYLTLSMSSAPCAAYTLLVQRALVWGVW